MVLQQLKFIGSSTVWHSIFYVYFLRISIRVYEICWRKQSLNAQIESRFFIRIIKQKKKYAVCYILYLTYGMLSCKTVVSYERRLFWMRKYVNFKDDIQLQEIATPTNVQPCGFKSTVCLLIDWNLSTPRRWTTWLFGLSGLEPKPYLPNGPSV